MIPVMRASRLPLAFPLATVAIIASHRGERFNITRIRTGEELFRRSVREFERRHWANAMAGFERLTTELPARDTLFPPTLWYLGRTHQQRSEWLLAAQTFTRLAESFPNDSLA